MPYNIISPYKNSLNNLRVENNSIYIKQKKNLKIRTCLALFPKPRENNNHVHFASINNIV